MTQPKVEGFQTDIELNDLSDLSVGSPSNGQVLEYNGGIWTPQTLAYAPLASPIFTGNPRAPTPSGGDNDTSIATTEFVQGELGGLGAPTMLTTHEVLIPLVPVTTWSTASSATLTAAQATAAIVHGYTETDTGVPLKYRRNSSSTEHSVGTPGGGGTMVYVKAYYVFIIKLSPTYTFQVYRSVSGGWLNAQISLIGYWS